MTFSNFESLSVVSSIVKACLPPSQEHDVSFVVAKVDTGIALVESVNDGSVIKNLLSLPGHELSSLARSPLLLTIVLKNKSSPKFTNKIPS